MTNQQHPITPPPELRADWRNNAPIGIGREEWLIDRAAQWGADQELEACCQWLDIPNNRSDCGDGWLMPDRLRRARRPKPPSLKKQACAALDTYIYGNPDHNDKQNTYNTIRKALEQLND